MNLTDENLKGDYLIFLISQPRAGSTLLQRILAAHPNVHTTAESWLMLYPAYALKRDGIDAEFNTKWAYNAVQEFLYYHADGEITYLQAIRRFAQELYGKALSETDAQLFLDKTPRYYFIIPQLYRLFPKAKYIFLIRNPLSVLRSIIDTWVGTNYHFLARYYSDLQLAPQLLLDGINFLGQDANVVKYEYLVSHPEQCIEELCNRLKLDYQPQMLNYNNLPELKGRMGDQKGVEKYSQITSDNISKWRDLALTPQERHFAISYINDLGKETIEELGYSYDELVSGIGSKSSQRRILFPWHIVVKPSSTWRIREKLVFLLALMVLRRDMIPMAFELFKEKLMENL